MTKIAILMYHRVINKTEHNRCYFERGTAVEPRVFEMQLKWLSKHSTFVNLAEAIEIVSNDIKGNYSVLTFDDGYSDVKNTPIPICDQLNIPICIFPIAGHNGDSNFPAYVDHYYAIIHYAKSRDQIRLKLLGNNQKPPALDENIHWWIKGPLKEELHKLKISDQLYFLEELAHILNSEIPQNICQELYLTKNELRNLYNKGVELGGHGYHHKQLTDIKKTQMETEIAESIKFLKEVGVSNPNSFCYPDGSYSEEVIKCLQQSGIEIAFTTNAGFFNRSISKMEIPRFFMRNIKPDEEAWLVSPINILRND
jgi:peptidoglycan/xylan/chitin deacetylase (PgdA/CDA1 family)